MRVNTHWMLIVTQDGKDVARWYVEELKGFNEESIGTICLLCEGLRRIP